MLKLPQWIQNIFDQSTCPFADCKKKLDKNGVVAVGIREEPDAETKKMTLSFFYEYKCNSCHNRSVFTGFPTTFEDYIGDMIEISNLPMEDPNQEERAHRRSKISAAEIKAARKFIRKVRDYKDFMKFFGIEDVEPDDGNEPKDK